MSITRVAAPAYAEVEALPAPTQPQRDECRKAAIALGRGVEWERTAEGSAFWSSVYCRLVAIADGEPLK